MTIQRNNRLTKNVRDDYAKYGESYWKDFDKKHGIDIRSAQALSNEDRLYVAVSHQKNLKRDPSKDFDFYLTDLKRYRTGSKWKVEGYQRLHKAYCQGKQACPFEYISIPMIKRRLYAERLNESKNSSKPKLELNLMDFRQAHEEFIEEYLKNSFINRGKSYNLDNNNDLVIQQLVAYFIRREESKLNPRKGICLYGNIGTGKTEIMKQLSRFTIDHNLPTQFFFVEMDEVYTGCQSKGLEFLDRYTFRRCAFDDIGMRAEENVNNFGTPINPYQELVRRQYKRYTRLTPSLSHYTTNYEFSTSNKDTARVLANRFGPREYDRFREMCNFVFLGGKSRRM